MEAKEYGIRGGLTGSPWFGEILRRHVPYLGGVNTIPTSDGAEGLDYDTAWPADYRRWETATEALSGTESEYGLWLTHFSNVDGQGHCCGVTEEFNTDNTYTIAVETPQDSLIAS